jgi:regulator of nucleoside diphosphate kinase
MMDGEEGHRPMRIGTTLVTDLDMLKLGEYVDWRRRWPGPNREHFQALRRKLNSAGVVRSADIPGDVITLQSRVRVKDMKDAGEATYTLVMPAEASAAPDTVSVMSPIGVELLGRRRGDEIECRLASGLTRLRIEDVLYQPEAAARPSSSAGTQERGS